MLMLALQNIQLCVLSENAGELEKEKVSFNSILRALHCTKNTVGLKSSLMLMIPYSNIGRW